MDVTEERQSYVPAAAPVSLAEISRVLEETARLVGQHAQAEGAPPRPAEPRSLLSAHDIRAIIAARWLRREFLGAELGEAEWSLILELYAAHLEGRRIHQTGLAVSAGVPQTTALNATRRLIGCGFFLAEPDPRDKRRLLIALSDVAVERIRAYLTAASRIAPPIA
jgi:DNA-binding MarR family transcriptional regulator